MLPAVFLSLVLTSQAASPAHPSAPAPSFQPTWESLGRYRCPDWFRDAKLGIWAVWGPECVPEQGDWYARNLYIQGHPQYEHHLRAYGHPSKVGYKDIIPLWKAERWDPDRLMRLYRRAGARYFCAIANHHDNFDCWDSKYQPWNSVRMGPRRDIVGDWAKAARRQGLRFGVTEHLGASWSWFQVAHGSDKTGPLAGVPYDGADPRWAGLYHAGNENAQGWYATNAPATWKQEWFDRIQDLVDRYQPDLLYSDGGLPYDDYGRRLVAHYYNRNRQQHGGRLAAVYAQKDPSPAVARIGVLDLERGVMGRIASEPWQTDTCVGDWYYKAGIQYKTPATVIHMLADIVSKNGCLLLNLPLRSDGTLDAQEERILTELARWNAVNGEAIFGTRPWRIYGEGPSRTGSGAFNEGGLRYTAEDIRFTTKHGTLYAIALGWPTGGTLLVRSLAARPQGSRVKSVRLLGYRGSLRWSQTAEGLRVTLPAKPPCDHAFALAIAGRDLQPAAANDTIRPLSDGTVLLHASRAEIHGASPQYEVGGGKDDIGYWGDAKDYVSWRFRVDRPGQYRVEVTYSCDSGAEGSRYAVEVGGQRLVGTSAATGSWAAFRTDTVGTLRIDRPGACTLSVKPVTPPAWKVIGLQAVKLVVAR